jgi:sulfite reductase alpha subunit-like flavoprotein
MTIQGGVLTRFFQRKLHPGDLLANNKFRFAVLGLGDSNLLLDRQTTTAKDCNQVAQKLDARLEKLGATRQFDVGMADEREDLPEVEPWIDGFWDSLNQKIQISQKMEELRNC